MTDEVRLGRWVKGSLVLWIVPLETLGVLMETLEASLSTLLCFHVQSVSKSCSSANSAFVIILHHHWWWYRIPTTMTTSHLQDRTSLITSSLLRSLPSLDSLEQLQGSFQNLKFRPRHSSDLMTSWLPPLLRGAHTMTLLALPGLLTLSSLASVSLNLPLARSVSAFTVPPNTSDTLGCLSLTLLVFFGGNVHRAGPCMAHPLAFLCLWIWSHLLRNATPGYAS